MYCILYTVGPKKILCASPTLTTRKGAEEVLAAYKQHPDRYQGARIAPFAEAKKQVDACILSMGGWVA